ncbi:MAG: diguanylate cyclase [Vitreoscilla sp.]|nr:diguanylate cyclase [Vitreoscilla sp.]
MAELRLDRNGLRQHPALDWRALFAEGLEHIRRQAGAVWTDHNAHDPGITTLELACYALTDLAYRCEAPIESLLADPGGSAEAALAQFFRAREVLPHEPWTERDLRKLLIDLPGVKNAWLLPYEGDDTALWVDPVRRELSVTQPGVPGERRFHLGGLQQPLIEFMDDVLAPADQGAVLAEVGRTLQAHRPLGEDFMPPRSVPVQGFALCAEIELAPGTDVVEAAARLLMATRQMLAPAVANYSLAEMLARPHPDGSPRTVDQVFEGPLLRHGFIADEDLDASALPTELHLSDLMQALASVDGVRALREVRLQPVDGSGEPLPVPNPWCLPVPAGHAPRLAPNAGRLVFHKRGLPVAGFNLGAQRPEGEAVAAPLRDAVLARLAVLREAERVKLETPREDDLRPAFGPAQPLARHRSFQLDFPALYGLGEHGLPTTPSPLHAAQILQFQAYLMLADQVMANQLAQLGGAGQALSVAPGHLVALATQLDTVETDSDMPRSLAAQRVVVPGHERLLDPAWDGPALARLFETANAAQARWHRRLDHLLARAAEDFGDYQAVMAPVAGSDLQDLAQRAADKARFLAELPALGAQRGRGWNQTLADGAWDSAANLSGLERRIARLLGITDPSRRNLALVAHQLYREQDAVEDNRDEWRFRVLDPADASIVLSSSTHYNTPEAARAEMMLAMAAGRAEAGYARETAVDGTHYFNIVDATGEVIARRIEYFATEDERDAAIAALIALLDAQGGGEEGLYLVENLQLRPTEAGDPLLPICLDAGCADCANDDPYSWRLQVVLPAYAGRFVEPGFRDFAEATIRAETPAHLCPKVCWAGPEAMAVFEAAYRDWIALHTGAEAGNRTARLQAFIDALTQVKNVYPPRRLFDCTAEEAKPPFILGRHSLGSL